MEQQVPTGTIRFTEAMRSNPGVANWGRFNAEWAQTAGPLRVGQRHLLDNNVRRRANNFMTRSGFDRTGLQAMHPLDSIGNRFINPRTQIGYTYYYGPVSVNASFGSQTIREIARLGLRPGDRFRLRFEGFPGYDVHPPIAPPSSPPDLKP